MNVFVQNVTYDSNWSSVQLVMQDDCNFLTSHMVVNLPRIL